MVTNYTAEQIINQLAGITTSTASFRGAYIGLSTTTPSMDGTNFTEPSSSSYKRLRIQGSSSSSSDDGNFIKFRLSNDKHSALNIAEAHFNVAVADYGTITYVGIFDAETGGHLLAYTALNTPMEVRQGYIPTILINNAEISIDAE